MISPSRADDRDRVGPYVLVKAIGAGGSARVDLAKLERAYGFVRHVVIKRPLEHLRGDARAAESLRREARLGGRLRHPNLVAILDAGVHDGYDYLALDYVHGGSLRTLMQTEEAARVRDVPLEAALAVVRDVARGVHEAHELHDERGAPLGLVHRDVSPGNVLIGLDGAVKLADFGIAKETRVATLSGSMHGTVTYMAPEQCRGHAFDRRADVFSIGVILYELVTGTRLFWADNDVASLHRVLEGTITRPRRVRAGISPELEEIVMTAVAHEQDKRFATARMLADAIEAYGTSAGQIFASRSVSRWAVDILGPRDAPWIGTETAVDIALPEYAIPATPVPGPEERISLVELIRSQTAPLEDISPTFGPTDAAMFEDGPTDTERAEPPARKGGSKKRAVIAGLVGAALAAGAIGVLAMGDNDNTEPAPRVEPAAAPPTELPVVPTEPAEQGSAAAQGSADEIEMEEIEVEELVETPGSKAPPVKRRVKKKRPKARPATTTTGTGSGSATKPPPKVEWDPSMLTPDDPKRPKKR